AASERAAHALGSAPPRLREVHRAVRPDRDSLRLREPAHDRDGGAVRTDADELRAAVEILADEETPASGVPREPVGLPHDPGDARFDGAARRDGRDAIGVRLRDEDPPARIDDDAFRLPERGERRPSAARGDTNEPAAEVLRDEEVAARL